jgi:hypothetical protein
MGQFDSPGEGKKFYERLQEIAGEPEEKRV